MFMEPKLVHAGIIRFYDSIMCEGVGVISMALSRLIQRLFNINAVWVWHNCPFEFKSIGINEGRMKENKEQMNGERICVIK